MHKLLAKQLARATSPSGQIDVAKLCEAVSAAYAETDHDRIRIAVTGARVHVQGERYAKGIYEAEPGKMGSRQ